MAELPWIQLAEAALSGGGVAWLTTFLNEKSKSRGYTMGAVDQAVKVALDSVTSEVSRLNKAHQDCLDHAAKMQEEMDELRSKIDELMKGKVPGYVIGPSRLP